MAADQLPLPQLVSVVIPCYNQARFLAEAIESVQAQTHPFFEIVVIDDGSTDDTVAVARRYKSVRCVTQRNQGQGAARNKGLTYVSGGYVVFLDSDDRLLPAALEIGLRCFAAHPQSAFVAGRCVSIDMRGVQQPVRHDPVVERDHYLRLLETNYIWTPGTVMFRTEVVRRIGGFKRTVSGAEDYDLYLRIARHDRIFCHDHVVTEYRQHNLSTSRRPMQMMRSSLNVMNGQRSAVRGDPMAERALREGIRHWQDAYGEQLINAVRKQLRAREWRQALPSLIGLLQYHPGGFFHHACRKISRVARGRKPESLDAIG
ncbi:MAG TPA: glycosyltransferase [Vicinamibacterales bacterium]|nr:glycosyltransferase [Vicinamibacterales bacterium]